MTVLTCKFGLSVSPLQKLSMFDNFGTLVFAVFMAIWGKLDFLGETMTANKPTQIKSTVKPEDSVVNQSV